LDENDGKGKYMSEPKNWEHLPRIQAIPNPESSSDTTHHAISQYPNKSSSFENYSTDNGREDKFDDETIDSSISGSAISPRFYCTDFPPCNLSFTRNALLARHIR
jgi:hypothetical protein